MTLYAHTLKLAKESGKSTTELGAMAGASAAWANLFLQGKITSPNVHFIERLYQGLSGRTLVSGD